MTTPDDARSVLTQHFLSMPPDELVREVDKLLGREEGAAVVPTASAPLGLGVVHGQPASLSMLQRRVPVNAYLASALTRLSPQQRTELFQTSDLVAGVAGEFDIVVYQPRHHTDPEHDGDVTNTDVFQRDKGRVATSDLVILITANPSFGAGEEAIIALAGLIPMILISQTSEKVSRMLTGMPGMKVHIVYQNASDLRDSLRSCLTWLRPILETRRAVFQQQDVNIVGERIRFLREEQGLTREMVVQEVSGLTPEALKQIEEQGDRTSNPTLVQLRQIAAALRTTVADLIEPDLMGRMVAGLQEWLFAPTRARAHGLSDRDRDAILRRMFIRLLQSLDHAE